jgi:hypothetical protein
MREIQVLGDMLVAGGCLAFLVCLLIAFPKRRSHTDQRMYSKEEIRRMDGE